MSNNRCFQHIYYYTKVTLPVSIQNFVPVPAVGLQVCPLANAPQLQRLVAAAGQHVVSIAWRNHWTQRRKLKKKVSQMVQNTKTATSASQPGETGARLHFPFPGYTIQCGGPGLAPKLQLPPSPSLCLGARHWTLNGSLWLWQRLAWLQPLISVWMDEWEALGEHVEVN